MSMSERDRALGMDRKITRRDFMNGVAVTAGAVAAYGAGMSALGARPAAAADAPYPPSLTGLRGHNAGAMEVMHALRDNSFWQKAGTPEPVAESYDLIVVGGGISGLAAAYLYRQQHGPDAKILVLEAQDDFGGHARRNEFTASNGRKLIGYGGSQSLQTPSYFSPAVKKLLADIDIDTEKFKVYYDSDWSEKRGLGEAVLFRKEVFGVDKLVKQTETAAEWVPETPLNEQAKKDLIELLDAPRDYLPGKSREEKLQILSETTYADFLTKICGYDQKLVAYFQNSTEGYFGMGIDGTTALDAWGNWNPGFDGMDLGDKAYKTMSPSGRLALTDPDPYIFHFPDGNAGVARALLRALVPDALPGSGMESLATAAVDYAALDRPENAVRIRINAPAMRVKHAGPIADASEVDITYHHEGKLHVVRGGHVVLACWHRVIPYLTDELGQEQIDALNDQVKVPLIYTNVQLRNWEALAKLGIGGFECPSGFWDGASIDFPVSMGDYKFAENPSDPIILHLSKIPLTGEAGVSTREQCAAGRQSLVTMTFEDMEREIRDMLARALGEAGFDPARDIEGITCNRWSHGYAYEYMRPWDKYWPDGELPIVKARQPWGRIAIANSDAGAYAYAHSAIDQAARAVRDLLGHADGLAAFADFPGPPRDMLEL
ncbi:NAD(P)-binding protein [Dongia sp.]|uniref:NAD(P)-binding protein n=1 Tax=Dongia sp. TaxID=1977262 RepID=UPI0034A4786F